MAKCAVVGVPDEVWGEAVVASVVMPSPGAYLESPTELSYDDMKSWCSYRMSSYKDMGYFLSLRYVSVWSSGASGRRSAEESPQLADRKCLDSIDTL